MDNAYKVYINDRGYTDWSFHTIQDLNKVQLDINPTQHKLFTNDIFIFDENGELKVTNSTIRDSTSIAGVLVLKNNKTFGRRKGKLLYKCIPDDMRIPSFLVPYEMKNVGFSKVFVNHYVTIQYCEWEGKHPIATISQNIGSVDILDNFYEYQLYCKSLHTSIQNFTKDTSKALKTRSHDAFIESVSKRYPSIEDRRDQTKWKIFSIDPETSLDLDDAFSVCDYGENVEQLSIYISNVTIWMDVLNLWKSFSSRISTIYLPDRKRPMLPTMLSDCLCSLQSGHTRLAFVMDIFINKETDEVIDMKYTNCMINVHKNYAYEEDGLLSNPDYNYLLDMTRRLSKRYRYMTNIKDSHDVVAYLMIFMNYNTGKDLMTYKNGIFRSTVLNKDAVVPENLDENVGKFLKMWNSSSGQYIDMNMLKEGQTVEHELLEMESYIHITSPIRRLVDLLNIIQFQKNHNMLELSPESYDFYKKWVGDIEYINTTMRSIRKVQNDCSLLHYCSTHPEVMSGEYKGFMFDKMERNDGLYQYVVYLPDLKLVSRIVVPDNIDNYTQHTFTLYLFHDEERFKKKIRIQLKA